MGTNIIDLLRRNYDEKYGVVNVRPVIDELMKTSPSPFEDVSAVFEVAERRWRMPILEAMRVLAAIGYCHTKTGAQNLLRATESMAAESGDDEYFKSVNALVASNETAASALTEFVSHLLERRGSDFSRRLAFYIVGMLLEHRKKHLTYGLSSELKSAAEAEKSDRLRGQFQELVNRL